MYAASFLKYLILLWGRKKFACGRERLRLVTAVDGSKWSAERGLLRLSYLLKKEMPTSEVNRRMMSASLLGLRARSGAHTWIYAG